MGKTTIEYSISRKHRGLIQGLKMNKNKIIIGKMKFFPARNNNTYKVKSTYSAWYPAHNL